jgi:A/G-specific adenine glycosylase
LRQSENGPEYFLIQRPETGLLAGLWDFPNIVLDDPEMDEPATETVLTEYLTSLGLVELGKLTKRGSSLHIFTHIRRTSQVYTVEASDSESSELQGKWSSEEEIAEMALSELGRKVFRLALGVEKKRKTPDGEEKVKIKSRKVVKLEKGQSKLSFAVSRKTKTDA